MAVTSDSRTPCADPTPCCCSIADTGEATVVSSWLTSRRTKPSSTSSVRAWWRFRRTPPRMHAKPWRNSASGSPCYPASTRERLRTPSAATRGFTRACRTSSPHRSSSIRRERSRIRSTRAAKSGDSPPRMRSWSCGICERREGQRRIRRRGRKACGMPTAMSTFASGLGRFQRSPAIPVRCLQPMRPSPLHRAYYVVRWCKTASGSPDE
jgi:hypothetical protein